MQRSSTLPGLFSALCGWEHGRLGRERGELSQERGELSRDHRELRLERGELGRERGELGRERSELSRDRRELCRECGGLGRECGGLGRERGELGQEHGELGRERGGLGRERGGLGCMIHQGKQGGSLCTSSGWYREDRKAIEYLPCIFFLQLAEGACVFMTLVCVPFSRYKIVRLKNSKGRRPGRSLPIVDQGKFRAASL